MAINYTSLLKLPKPDAGTPAWTTYWHRAMDITSALSGQVVTVTKVTGATTLADADGTNDKGKHPIIRTAVTLTGNVQVNVPARNRFMLAENLSSGAFTWKIQTASNSIGVNVPQGRRMWLRSTTTGVIAISRTDGRTTATELGVGVITATHLAASSVTTAKIGSGVVTATKLAAAASYGRLLVSQTGAFRWAELARGTSRQVLAMSTAASPLPAWREDVLSRVATSTAFSFSAGSVLSYTHGLGSITNKYDYRLFQAMLVCLSADTGYSAGDVVYAATLQASDNGGISLVADSTTVVKVVVSNVGVTLPNKGTGAAANITESNWSIRIRVGA